MITTWLLLLGCAGSLDGELGFRVGVAFVNVCTAEDGDTVAMMTLESHGSCGRVYGGPTGYECGDIQVVAEDQPAFCTAVAQRTSNSDDALYAGEVLADGGELDGLVFDGADRYSCQEQSDEGHWLGDLETLAGTVSVSTVSDDTATLTFDLDGVTGSLDAEVCR